MQADLRVLLLEWYGFHWHRAQRELREAVEFSRSQETKLDENRKAYQNIRQDFTVFRDRLNGLRARLNSWHRQSAQLHENRESASQSLATLEERQRALLDNRQTAVSNQSRLAEETRIAAERVKETETEMARLQAEFDEAQEQMKTAQSALSQRQAERFRLEGNIQSARQKLEQFTKRQASLQARSDELRSRADGQKEKISTVSTAIQSLENEVETVSEQLIEAEKIRQRAEDEVKKAETSLQVDQRRLADLEKQIKDKQSLGSQRQADQARVKIQMDVLDQAEQSLAGYAEGAKILLDAARGSKLAGARGALSSALDIPAELEAAIAAALGEYADAILLEFGQHAEQALALLDANPSGRASLLPLDWLSPQNSSPKKEDADCLGIAADLVKVPPELRPAIDLLLGQVLVVRDRKAARRVLAGQHAGVRAVTLQGEVFFATGQILAGKQTKATALGRPRQRRELQESLVSIGRQTEEIDSELRKLAGQAETMQEEINTRQDDLSAAWVRLEAARTEELQSQSRQDSIVQQRNWQINQKTSLETEILQAEKENEQNISLLAQNSKDIGQTQEGLKTLTASLSDLSLEDVQEQTTIWSTRSAVTTRALNDVRRQLTERQEAARHLQEQQIGIEKMLAEIAQSLADLDLDRARLHNQTAGTNSQLDELRKLIEPTEKELEETEAQENDLQKQETEGQMVLARVERTYNQIQLDLGRKQEMLQNLRQKIEDDFGLVAFEYATDVSGPVPLPFDGMVEQLPTITELPPDLEENMTRQRAQLRRMGAVNPEAQQEYQSVKERHTF